MAEKTTLLFVGDVHVSDRPPSTRRPGYREQILEKLIEIGRLAREHEATAVLFVGDIFHSKKPAATSHQTVRATAHILDTYPCPVFIVPGNHDYAARNPMNLASSPLGTVALMPNVSLIGLPGHRHQLVTPEEPYVVALGVREEEPVEAFGIGSQVHATVVVAHSAIFPPGQTPGVWEAFDAQEIREFYDQVGEDPPDLLWYGHIHEPHGVYEVEGMTFANLGAISRGSLHEEGALERTPAIGKVTITGDKDSGYEVGPIEEIPLRSALPAEEVFRIEEVAQERSEAAEAVAFAEALSEAEVEVFSVEAAIRRLSEDADVEQAVRERAVELIEAVTDGGGG